MSSPSHWVHLLPQWRLFSINHAWLFESLAAWVIGQVAGWQVYWLTDWLVDFTLLATCLIGVSLAFLVEKKNGSMITVLFFAKNPNTAYSLLDWISGAVAHHISGSFPEWLTSPVTACLGGLFVRCLGEQPLPWLIEWTSKGSMSGCMKIRTKPSALALPQRAAGSLGALLITYKTSSLVCSLIAVTEIWQSGWIFFLYFWPVYKQAAQWRSECPIFDH